MKSRAQRRAHRERMIARRTQQWRNHAGVALTRFHFEPSRFAKRSPLGCPDGRKCFLCHTAKALGLPRRSELLADLVELDDFE